MDNRNKPFRDAVIRVVGDARGLHITERTTAAELGELIRSLRPMQCPLPLIRLGPDTDGGYLLPDDLAGIRFAYSPGVSTESRFEQALADRGIDVFLADRSVDGPAHDHPRFHFLKKYVGCVSDDGTMTLADWKEATAADYRDDLLLQMDIEGAEYVTLLSTPPALLAQFRIIVIEFHQMEDLYNRPFFQIAAQTFRRLLESHAVVHIHPNDCCGTVRGLGLEVPRVAEFTFLRRDRARMVDFANTFPHPLDRNNTSAPTVPLPRCWYA